MLPSGYAVVALGTVAWLMPFVVHQRNAAKAAEIDPRARWGLILLAVAYSLLWQGSFWKRSPGPWRVMVAVMSFAAASAVCWAGVRALGRQWRIDAAAIAFAAGTAIRVRIEDGLLRRRFGPAFDDYRGQVPAFFPRLRSRSL